MLRTCNFTGRKKIELEHAVISWLNRTGDAVIFNAALHLSEYQFPPQAQVFVEAYFRTTTERFSYGTVGEMIPSIDCQLKRLTQPDLVSFRVKVVEAVENGMGRLLGVKDRIKPEGLQGPEKRKISLFRVNPKADLTNEIWQLDLEDSDGEGPILNLNQGVPGIKERVKEEEFMALVFPDLMRKIFTKIFEDGYDDPDHDRDDWHSRWLRFGEKLAKDDVPTLNDGKPTEEQIEWINKVIAAWSHRQKIVPNFVKNGGNK